MALIPGLNIAAPKSRKAKTKARPKLKNDALSVGPASHPFLGAQKKANQKVRDAEAKLPANHDEPRLPVLKHYTPEQRKAITKSYLGYVHERSKHTGETPGEILASQNLQDGATRQYLHKVQGLGDTNAGKVAKRYGGATEGNPEAYAPPKQEHHSIKLGGTTKIAGIPLPGLHQLAYGVDHGLRELQRPESFVIGAANAAQSGQPILKGAIKNFKTNKLTASDLLRKHGMGNTPAAILGLGADIALDPFNLATAGAAPVASNLLREAGRASTIAKGLRETGGAENVARAVSHEQRAAKLVEQAQHASHNRGIQVGLRLGRKKLVTSGERSATAMRASGLSKLAGKIHDEKHIASAGKILSATYRPADATPAEWQAWRDVERQMRGQTSKGRDYWFRFGKAVNQELKNGGTEADHAHIIKGLEGAAKPPHPAAPGELPPLPHGEVHQISDLKPHEAQVARELSGHLAGFAHGEYAKGMLHTVRNDYVPHILTKDAREAGAYHGTSAPHVNVYDRVRDDPRTMDVINEEHPGKFETNLGTIMSERGAKHEALMAHREGQDETVSRVATMLHDRPLTALRDGDRVYIHSPFEPLRSVANKRGRLTEHAVSDARHNLKEGERLVVMPRSIGDAAIKGAGNGKIVDLKDEDLAGFWKGFDKVMGKVKTGLTVLNLPAYQLRNLMGDTFNARIAGTSVKSLLDGGRVVAHRVQRDGEESSRIIGRDIHDKTIQLGHGRELSASEILDLAEQHHVTGSGHYGFDLQEQADQQAGRYGLGTAKRLGGKATQKIRDVGQNMEDTTRLGTFIDGLKRGMSPEDAAAWTAQHHFDYADLSPGEQVFLKRLFPFWTFTARNTPLQAKGLLRRPGVYANYGLAQEEGRKQAGLPADYQDRLPGYLQRQLAIPVNIHGHRSLLSPQLPITDLNHLQALTSLNTHELVQEGAQMVNPLVKAFGEYALDYSAFFRGPIYQNEDNPEAKHWVPAPAWTKLMPMFGRKILAGGNEEAARKGLWTAKADYLARQTPQSNAFAQATTTKTGSRGQTWGDALFSQGTGIKKNAYTPEAYSNDALYKKADELQARQKDAKALGHTAEAKRLGHKRYELLKGTTAGKKKAHKSGGGNAGGFGGSSGSGGGFGGGSSSGGGF